MTNLAERMDIEVDDEGVFRIIGHDADDVVSFTCGDFGRFLTEFVSALQSHELTEDLPEDDDQDDDPYEFWSPE